MSPPEDCPAFSAAFESLSQNQGRVAAAVDALDRQIQALISAAVREDWEKVAFVSRHMAAMGRAEGRRSLAALAQQVYEDASQPNNEVAVKRSLIRLIGTHGRQ